MKPKTVPYGCMDCKTIRGFSRQDLELPKNVLYPDTLPCECGGELQHLTIQWFRAWNRAHPDGHKVALDTIRNREPVACWEELQYRLTLPLEEARKTEMQHEYKCRECGGVMTIQRSGRHGIPIGDPWPDTMQCYRYRCNNALADNIDLLPPDKRKDEYWDRIHEARAGKSSSEEENHAAGNGCKIIPFGKPREKSASRIPPERCAEIAAFIKGMTDLELCFAEGAIGGARAWRRHRGGGKS